MLVGGRPRPPCCCGEPATPHPTVRRVSGGSRGGSLPGGEAAPRHSSGCALRASPSRASGCSTTTSSPRPPVARRHAPTEATISSPDSRQLLTPRSAGKSGGSQWGLLAGGFPRLVTPRPAGSRALVCSCEAGSLCASVGFCAARGLRGGVPSSPSCAQRAARAHVRGRRSLPQAKPRTGSGRGLALAPDRIAQPQRTGNPGVHHKPGQAGPAAILPPCVFLTMGPFC